MSGYHKNEVYALLNEKGIPYEAVEHEAVFTMEEMERAGIDAHGCICKNLFRSHSLNVFNQCCIIRFQ